MNTENLAKIQQALTTLGVDAVVTPELNVVPVLLVHSAGIEIQIVAPEGMEALMGERFWSIGQMDSWTMEWTDLDSADEDATLAAVTHKILAQIV